MDANEFFCFLEDNGFEPRKYSGRGMFGAQCVGVIQTKGTPSVLVQIGYLIGMDEGGTFYSESDKEEFVEQVANYSSDNFGHDTIYYWPYMKFVEDAED